MRKSSLVWRNCYSCRRISSVLGRSSRNPTSRSQRSTKEINYLSSAVPSLFYICIFYILAPQTHFPMLTLPCLPSRNITFCRYEEAVETNKVVGVTETVRSTCHEMTTEAGVVVTLPLHPALHRWLVPRLQQVVGPYDLAHLGNISEKIRTSPKLLTSTLCQWLRVLLQPFF
jgi:hypothetical protein